MSTFLKTVYHELKKILDRCLVATFIYGGKENFGESQPYLWIQDNCIKMHPAFLAGTRWNIGFNNNNINCYFLFRYHELVFQLMSLDTVSKSLCFHQAICENIAIGSYSGTQQLSVIFSPQFKDSNEIRTSGLTTCSEEHCHKRGRLAKSVSLQLFFISLLFQLSRLHPIFTRIFIFYKKACVRICI